MQTLFPGASPDSLLTPKQARLQLGIGNTHLYALVKAGKLRLIKLGKCSRFRSSDIAVLMSNGTGGHNG